VFIQATIKLRKEATSDVIAILQTVITSEGIGNKNQMAFHHQWARGWSFTPSLIMG
jgi:hypothetical protein